MSPLKIKILLHYHAFVDDYNGNGSPAEKDAFGWFLEDGYLDRNESPGVAPYDGEYRPTEKLHIYCDALCKVPEPEQRWVVGGGLVAGQGE